MSQSAQPTIRILLLDDDPDMESMLEHYLLYDDTHRFSISQARTSADASKLLLNSKFHLVLVDYELGVEKGDVFAYITSMANSNLPIILLTGQVKSGLNEETQHLLENGTILYMNKREVSQQRIGQKLADIITERTGLN